MTQLLIAFLNAPADLLLDIAAVSDPGLVGLISLDEIAVFFDDETEAEFGRFWAPRSEIIDDAVLMVSRDEHAILRCQGLAFSVGKAIRLEISEIDQVEAIELVVAQLCERFAMRGSDQELGCEDPMMCLTEDGSRGHPEALA